jgi:hypothetical protein
MEGSRASRPEDDCTGTGHYVVPPDDPWWNERSFTGEKNYSGEKISIFLTS